MILAAEILNSVALFADTLEIVKEPGFHDVYAASMRNSLFTGFLTLSGFLLTAKTFLVVNMNKEVYTSDHYLENFRVQHKVDDALEVYGPLSNTAKLLYWNIVVTLLTAVAQFTIGFIPSAWAAGFCLCAVLVAIAFMGYSLLQVRRNLARMFSFLESVAKGKLVKLEREAEAAKQKRQVERDAEVREIREQSKPRSEPHEAV